MMSTGNAIQIWNINTEELITKLNGHTAAVRCVLKLSNTIVASGSDDNTIQCMLFISKDILLNNCKWRL
jgi:WD40 repeat protein